MLSIEEKLRRRAHLLTQSRAAGVSRASDPLSPDRPCAEPMRGNVEAASVAARCDPMPAPRWTSVLDAAKWSRGRSILLKGGPGNLREVPGSVGPSIAYFDTETTSLHAGAGVWIFLSGVLRCEGSQCSLIQSLLESPELEGPWLESVRKSLLGAELLVTFCGRGFDLPRLRDRFSYSGQSFDWPKERHLDLKPVARRLFGHRIPNGRLQTLERRVLGINRVDDLPGAECPAAYFSYLRGDPLPLSRVLEHNRQDVLNLSTLEERCVAALFEPSDAIESGAAGLLALRADARDLARDRLVECSERLATESASRAALRLTGFGDQSESEPATVPAATTVVQVARGLRKFGETDRSAALLDLVLSESPNSLSAFRDLLSLYGRQLNAPSDVRDRLSLILHSGPWSEPLRTELVRRLARIDLRARGFQCSERPRKSAKQKAPS